MTELVCHLCGAALKISSFYARRCDKFIKDAGQIKVNAVSDFDRNP